MALYLGGFVALCLALLSPIDTLGSLLFSVHMVQHERLTMAAPPPLLLGNPLPVVLLRGCASRPHACSSQAPGSGPS